MKITFEIYYHTRWGESLFLSGDIDELGANEDNRAVMMDYQGDGLWKYTMELPASAKKFHYEYLVKSGEGIRRLGVPDGTELAKEIDELIKGESKG